MAIAYEERDICASVVRCPLVNMSQLICIPS